MVAVVGAVTVVLSANTSDTQLDTDALIRAISQRPFVIYSVVYIMGGVILSGLSEGGVGRKYVFVDVGLCAIFGECYHLAGPNSHTLTNCFDD